MNVIFHLSLLVSHIHSVIGHHIAQCDTTVIVQIHAITVQDCVIRATVIHGDPIVSIDATRSSGCNRYGNVFWGQTFETMCNMTCKECHEVTTVSVSPNRLEKGLSNI